MTHRSPSPGTPVEPSAASGPSAAGSAAPSPPPLDAPTADATTSRPIWAEFLGTAPRPVPVWHAPPGAWAQWSSSSAQRGVLRWRELVCVALLVTLADLTLYRGHGFAGCAALLVLAPGLLLAGSPDPKLHKGFWIVAGMLLLLAARMVWLGSALETAVGFALVVASAMAIAGRRLFVLDIGVYALQTVAAGGVAIAHYLSSTRDLSPKSVRVPWLSILLPLAALAAFGTLFVLANPDLHASFSDMIRRAMQALTDWFERLPLDWGEVFFWIATAWVVAGLLRPIVERSVLARYSTDGRASAETTPAESPLYAALRNTLWALIALYVVYLVFEFWTLWFREFPKGFYYAGYAHEGAAWLTASLALATVVLSAIFRGRVLRDPRLPRLRRLAWIWSAENLVLAATVYNRLWIYVAFNGMTRMRTVALFGVSAVVAGVFLVIVKILWNRDFVWLVRRHLAALALVIFLYALTPVDTLVHTYNVRRVLAGDLAPSVQISVHPIDAEGILVLHPLLDCHDEIIRKGIRAMLAERWVQSGQSAQQQGRQDWTAFQIAERLLAVRLYAIRDGWSGYLDASKRAAALKRFGDYAYQWY